MDATNLSLIQRRHAVIFIVLIGCISLFADMTYEGGRSIAGPFLGTLGASAVVVSVVAGLGEFLGYGVRYLFGRRRLRRALLVANADRLHGQSPLGATVGRCGGVACRDAAVDR